MKGYRSRKKNLREKFAWSNVCFSVGHVFPLRTKEAHDDEMCFHRTTEKDDNGSVAE